MHQIIHSTITETATRPIDDSGATQARRARLAQARAVVIAQFGAAILVPPIARPSRTIEKRTLPNGHPTSQSAVAHARR